MTRVADIQDGVQAAEIKLGLLGKKCWQVGCGGAAGYSFTLDLGEKLVRPAPARKSSQTKTQFVGESHLLVWCSWVLYGPRGPITSSNDETEGLEKGLARLVGQTVQAVDIEPQWCLSVSFSHGLLLKVFPDHVGPMAIFDGNWELWRPLDAYLIGTNLKCKVVQREYPPLPLNQKPAWRGPSKARESQKK